MAYLFNALFSAARGGLEQAHLDTTASLVARGHRVRALAHPQSLYLPQLSALTPEITTFRPHGFYDVITALCLRALIRREKPDAIMAHNSRAIVLLHWAMGRANIPLIGMTHGYKIKRITQADHLIVLTPHMQQFYIQHGVNAPQVHILPNLIHLPAQPPAPNPRGAVPIIGALGRMVPEKGFADLLHACALLHQRGIAFQLLLAGDGPQKNELMALAQTLGISSQVNFSGWVDKSSFYPTIDLFCLPSHFEPFGIVLLEAMAQRLPIISTNVSGPASILSHQSNALLVPPANTEELANATAILLADSHLAQTLAQSAWNRVQDYDFLVVSKKLDDIIQSILASSHNRHH